MRGVAKLVRLPKQMLGQEYYIHYTLLSSLGAVRSTTGFRVSDQLEITLTH